MLNDTEVAEAEKMRDEMRAFFMQEMVELAAAPPSKEIRKLIDAVAAGDGLSTSLAASLEESGQALAKAELRNSVSVLGRSTPLIVIDQGHE